MPATTNGFSSAKNLLVQMTALQVFFGSAALVIAFSVDPGLQEAYGLDFKLLEAFLDLAHGFILG